jgi:hypothetical protein
VSSKPLIRAKGRSWLNNFHQRAWCLSVGRLPHTLRAVHLTPTPRIVDGNVASDWSWPTEHGFDPERISTQSSNIRTIYTCFCALSEVIHDCLYVLYTPSSNLTSDDILGIYTEYLEWYNSLPSGLRFGENASPAALFLQ